MLDSLAPARCSAEGVDVGNEVIDRLVIVQNFGHQRHLTPVQVLRMSTANTLFEILQLSDQIPIAHALQPRGIHCLHAAPIRTVARSTRHIALLTIVRVAFDRRWCGIVRQCFDIGADIGDGGVVRQRRRHRRHHLAEHILVMCAPGTALEVFQLPFQIPVSLPAQFRRIQRQVALRLRPMAGSTHCIELLARGGIARC